MPKLKSIDRQCLKNNKSNIMLKSMIVNREKANY